MNKNRKRALAIVEEVLAKKGKIVGEPRPRHVLFSMEEFLDIVWNVYNKGKSDIGSVVKKADEDISKE